MTQGLPDDRRFGRGLFSLGLAAWVWAGWTLIPFDASDLSYVLALEGGVWAVQEFVHPLFVPVLAMLEALLPAAGAKGSILLALAVLNLAAAGGALVLLFLLAERLSSRSAAAAAAVLGFAWAAAGFWVACLRPTPYSLAALCLALACRAILAEGPRARRMAQAGLWAGLACGLHLAALSFVVPAAVASSSGRGRLFVRFLACMGAALLGCYAVFFLYHRLDPRIVLGLGGRDLLAGVEQVPTTSFWSNPQPLTLGRDYLDTLRVQARFFLALLAAAALLKAMAGELRESMARLRKNGALALAAALFAAFSAFYALNNTRNGFVFASLLALPVVLAELVPVRRSHLAGFALAALALAGSGAREVLGHESSAGRDPVYREALFLSRTLGASDAVLVPGCPIPELERLSGIRLIPAAPSGRGSHEGPHACPDRPVRPMEPGRVADLLAAGRRVLYAPAPPGGARDLDYVGDLKKRQAYAPFHRSAAGQERCLAGIERVLSRFHSREVRSPQGRVYRELLPVIDQRK
ncbi:MAG: hypothetical protein HY924_12625 [Elusimicrobia bacterium]|nr:hypothetical protein [Elusimicrobiota bacterium]